MLIVISYPNRLDNEISLINQLFDAGLSLFHLRKPNFSLEEMSDFLSKISSKYRSKIALHSCHELAKEFGVKRLHFTEENRKKTSSTIFESLKDDGFTLSTSIHTFQNFEEISTHFSSIFCSPIFDSISKPNYKAVKFDLTQIEGVRNTKLIALGGINSQTIEKALLLGFDSVAALGAIWESENPVNEFQILNEKCLTVVQ